jgi:hypothetical protein
MLMGVTSWELGVLRVPLIMVPDNADFDIYHDLYDLIIGEHVSHIPEEILSYIVSHWTRTTIHFCLNKKVSVCLQD